MFGLQKLIENPNPSDCILFEGDTDEKGYGVLCIKGQTFSAHAISMALNKPLEYEPRRLVCHTCDNPRCINPEHLYYGTHADNIHDWHDHGKHTKIDKRKKYKAPTVNRIKRNFSGWRDFNDQSKRNNSGNDCKTL